MPFFEPTLNQQRAVLNQQRAILNQQADLKNFFTGWHSIKDVGSRGVKCWFKSW